MEVRLAVPADLPQLEAVYQKIIRHMDESGVPIWDEVYPCALFAADVEARRLYIVEKDGRIAGAFALCDSSAGETLIGWFRQVVDQAIMRMLRPAACSAQQIQALADAECQAFCAGVGVLLETCAAGEPAHAAWLIDGYLELHVGGMVGLLRRGFASGAILPGEVEQNA